MLGLVAETLDGTREILIVVPSHAFTSVLEQIHRLNPEPASLSWATKGLEPGRRRLLHEAASGGLPQYRAWPWSPAPPLPWKWARGLPTAVTVASPDPEHAGTPGGLSPRGHLPCLHRQRYHRRGGGGCSQERDGHRRRHLRRPRFRRQCPRRAHYPGAGRDHAGSGLALGGEHDTFMGLAGLGDLVLTCTDNQSRNRRIGAGAGRGPPPSRRPGRRSGRRSRGLAAARDFQAESRRARRGNALITQAVFKVLYEGLEPGAAVKSLLARDPREEQESRSA